MPNYFGAPTFSPTPDYLEKLRKKHGLGPDAQLGYGISSFGSGGNPGQSMNWEWSGNNWAQTALPKFDPNIQMGQPGFPMMNPGAPPFPTITPGAGQSMPTGQMTSQMPGFMNLFNPNLQGLMGPQSNEGERFGLGQTHTGKFSYGRELGTYQRQSFPWQNRDYSYNKPNFGRTLGAYTREPFKWWERNYAQKYK